jgi:hypothetical protein
MNNIPEYKDALTDKALAKKFAQDMEKHCLKCNKKQNLKSKYKNLFFFLSLQMALNVLKYPQKLDL